MKVVEESARAKAPLFPQERNCRHCGSLVLIEDVADLYRGNVYDLLWSCPACNAVVPNVFSTDWNTLVRFTDEWRAIAYPKKSRFGQWLADRGIWL